MLYIYVYIFTHIIRMFRFAYADLNTELYLRCVLNRSKFRQPSTAQAPIVDVATFSRFIPDADLTLHGTKTATTGDDA